MRHFFNSPGKLGLKLGFMLALAISMMWFSTQVSLAQSCEVEPLDVRSPLSTVDTGVTRDIYPAVGIDEDKVQAEINTVVSKGLLSCGSNYQAPFYTKPLEYVKETRNSYSIITEKNRYITVFVSCVPQTGNSVFPEDPTISTHDYTKPWVTFGGLNTQITVDENGLVNFPQSIEQFQENVVYDPSPPQSIHDAFDRRETSTSMSYSFIIPNEVIAITYKEYEIHYNADTPIGGETYDTKFDKLTSNLALSYITAKIGALFNGIYESFVLAAIDGEVSNGDVVGMIGSNISSNGAGNLDFAGPTADIIGSGIDASEDFLNWAATIKLMNSNTPYVYSSPYQDSEVNYVYSSAIIDGVIERTLPGGIIKKIAVEWDDQSKAFLIAGANFPPGSIIHYKIGILGEPLLTEGYLASSSAQGYTLPETSPYLDYGILYRAIPVDESWNVQEGCYFVSVYAYGAYNNNSIVKAGNFVQLSGLSFYGPFLPDGYTASGTSNHLHTIANPVVARTCSNPIDVLTNHANTFSGTNCSSEISWFSGHPENGPSASGQGSLFVPNNAVVKVSSEDNGNGDTACFSSHVIDLNAVGWANRIQWAQLVPGGTCQPVNPPSPDYITLNTSGGDVLLHVGETWQNNQNWQVTKVWQHGSTNVTLSHKAGLASRCWDYDVMNLQNDGDWPQQTASATVASGTCPGNDAVLCRNDDGTDCKAFEVGEYSLLETNLNDVFRSLASVGTGKSIMMYRENGSMGTAECYNDPRIPLPSGGDWDLRGQVTNIQVFSQPNCPVSEIKAVVMYRDFDQGGAALGLGTQPGVINLTQVPGPINGNDWGASVRIPNGMSLKAYIHTDKGGSSTSCETGNANWPGEFYHQVSSIWLFDNTGCFIPAMESAFWGNTDGTFTAADTIQVAGTYTPVSGDFNGDGRSDIYWYAPGATGEVIFLGNADSTFTGLDTTNVAGTFTPVSGDFNGDGRSDIYWYAPGATAEVIFLGNADGTFTGLNTTNIGGTYIPVSGDFNGDGRDDIYLYAPGATGEVIFLGKTDGTFTGLNTTNVAGTYTPVSGDFNGDGRDDIYWYAPGATGEVIFLGKTDGTFTGLNTTNIANTATPVSGDFNGDGRFDIYWYGGGLVVASSLSETQPNVLYLPLVNR